MSKSTLRLNCEKSKYKFSISNIQWHKENIPILKERKMEQVHHPAGQTQIMKVPVQYLGLVG